MSNNVLELFERMTPEEQAEVETFAAFVIARRKMNRMRVLSDDIPTAELVKLVADGGSFDWLESDEQDGYSLDDGDEIEWEREL